MILNEKRVAFLHNNKEEYREKEKEFRRQARIAKHKYKSKVEDKLKTGNAKAAWDGKPLNA